MRLGFAAILACWRLVLWCGSAFLDWSSERGARFVAISFIADETVASPIGN